MPARSPIPESRIRELEDYRKTKWEGLEHQRFLCVWLRVRSGMSAVEIAGVLGCHPDTARSIQREFIARGCAVFRDENNGGRRNQLMTEEEERAFLEGFANAAKDALMLTAGRIKAALEKRLGREVNRSTVYRMLMRHNWRKVVPRPRHPKQDKKAADAFKKRASRTG